VVSSKRLVCPSPGRLERGVLCWCESGFSPDLNPIEQVFSKLKTLLRKTAARTVEALWSAIGSLLDSFAADECARYIAQAGYSQSE
jgi:hypothetical protein